MTGYLPGQSSRPYGLPGSLHRFNRSELTLEQQFRHGMHAHVDAPQGYRLILYTLPDSP